MRMGTLADILKFTIGLPILMVITIVYSIATVGIFVGFFIFGAEIHYDMLQDYRRDTRDLWTPNNGIATYGYAQKKE